MHHEMQITRNHQEFLKTEKKILWLTGETVSALDSLPTDPSQKIIRFIVFKQQLQNFPMIKNHFTIMSNTCIIQH